MKKLIFILFVIVFISCKTDKNEFVELNEKDAYLLINEYFVKDIQRGNDKIIFSKKQYIKPDITVEDIENIKKEVYFPDEYFDEHIDIDISDVEIEQPIFLTWSEKLTKNKWNQEKLTNISFLKKQHNEKVNDSLSLKNILIEEFGNSRIHHVSYPIYYPKEKIAIIFDEPYDVGFMSCISSERYYIYIKENNGWRSLKELGKYGVYGTLHNYYRERNLNSTHKPSK